VDNRPDWPIQHMRQAISAAQRSSCLKRRVGATIVRGLQVIATGYNGAPPGVLNCIQLGHCYYDHLAHQACGGDPTRFAVEQELHKQYCNALHAEENALAQCSSLGTPAAGADMYTTSFPCPRCAKQIIANKIKNVFVWQPYLQNAEALIDEYRVSVGWFNEAKINFEFIDDTSLLDIFGPGLFPVGIRTDYQYVPKETKPGSA
jgi:dCMP deaminase